MKNPFRLILLTTALAVSTLVSSSCANYITKDDVKDLGTYVAKQSLDIAQAYATGEEVDFQKASINLGFDVANLALKKVQTNLANESLTPPVAGLPMTIAAATPDQIVEDALSQATDQLNAQMGADPLTTQLAIQAAETAVAKALATLDSPPKSGVL